MICLALGAGGSFLLYYRTRKDDLKPFIQAVMIALRFLGIFLISFLLLSPLVKRTTEMVQKPVIIIAQDNSISVGAGRDSLFYKKDYPAKLAGIADELRKKYDVATFSFGEKIDNSLKTDYSERTTDISEMMDELLTRYANRNVGAVILASDGIYNKGTNPFYASQSINFPVYTIAMGDTIRNRDIILRNILYNRSVFLGDKFPVEVNLEADKCEGETSALTVKKGEQVLFMKKLVFNSSKSLQKVDLFLDAKEKGVHRYSISLTPVKGEITEGNNQQDIFVEVSESRQKVAVLYQSPHPDISAIRSALESTMKFEVNVQKIDDFTDPPDKYDLIVLYQLPSRNPSLQLGKVIGSGTPLLYCIGSQTDLDAFNNLKTGLEVSSSKMSFVEAVPQWNDAFSLFTMDKSSLELFKGFPPLLAPFGTFRFSPAADVLFFEKIGSVTSQLPLALFVQNSSKKTGILVGENIWKWRLYNYQQKDDHIVFDNLMSKIAQFLSVKADKSFFRVKCNTRFEENEHVEFDAEVYNESYELINDQDVSLTISDEHNKTYPFVFGKTEKAYYLDAGTFPPGAYHYLAQTRVGKNLYQKNGDFVISKMNLEMTDLTADHNLLYRISKSHGGEMVYPKDMDKLVQMIRSREDVRPVSYTERKFADLAGSLWFFLIILAAVSAEWFLRRRSGIY
jgi:hypothetical protein